MPARQKPKRPEQAPVKPRRPESSRAARDSKLTPSADLVQLAGQIPAELLQQLADAVRSRHWLFAVWTVSDGQIRLERTAAEFPIVDLDKAVEMLGENLQPLKAMP